MRFPTHDEDVAAAVAWVHDHIAEHGGDPDRIALLGHSAGAQIAASVATDPRYLGAHGLGLDALRCAGALDTEGYDVAAHGGHGQPDLPRRVRRRPRDLGRRVADRRTSRAGSGIPRFLVVERGTPASTASGRGVRRPGCATPACP